MSILTHKELNGIMEAVTNRLTQASHGILFGVVKPPPDNGLPGPGLPPGQRMLPGPNDSPNFPPPIYDDLLNRHPKRKMRLGDGKYVPTPRDLRAERIKNA